MTTNVQEVFDKVIAGGYYSDDKAIRFEKSGLMCFSLLYAYSDDVITDEEYHVAKIEIDAYLQGFGSLSGKLDNKKLPWQFENRLTIYKDWANRPTFGEVK